MKRLTLLAVLLALAGAACGSRSGPPEVEGSTTAPAAGGEEEFQETSGAQGGTGEKISVAEATSGGHAGNAVVEGYAIYEGGNYLLCEKVTAAGGCGEPSLLMEGYDGDFSPEKKVEVEGMLEGDLLRVAG